MVLQHRPTVEAIDFLEQARTVIEGSGLDFEYQVRFPMFDVPPDAPIITAERVQRFIDEEGLI